MAESNIPTEESISNTFSLIKAEQARAQREGEPAGIRCHPQTHFINLQYIYDDIDKTPAAFVPYTLNFADKTCRTGFLDQSGQAFEEFIPVGPIIVQYGEDQDYKEEETHLRQEFQKVLNQIITDRKYQQELQAMTLADSSSFEIGAIHFGALLTGVYDGARGLSDDIDTVSEMLDTVSQALSKAGIEYLDIVNCLVTGNYNELERKARIAREKGQTYYEEASETSENLILLLSDGGTRQALLKFVKQYWDSRASIETYRKLGVATFDVALGILIAAAVVATSGLATPAVAILVTRLGRYVGKAVEILQKLVIVLKKIRTKNEYEAFSKDSPNKKVTHIINKKEDAGNIAESGKTQTGEKSEDIDKTITCNDPISQITGEELLQQTDFTFTGPLSLTWTRTYRTSNAQDVGLGHGWTHPLIGWLSSDWQFIYYHNQEGRKIPFPIPQKGQYSTNTVEKIRLSAQEDGLYRLQFLKDNQPDRLFQHINGVYRLHALEDSIGNTLQCLHNDHGQITQLLGDWGKGLRFHYQGKHIIQIDELSVNDETAESSSELDKTKSSFHTINRVRYQYNQQNDLIAIIDPANNKEQFSYKNHMVTQRTLKSGFSYYFEWDQYNPKGQCIRQYGDNGFYDYHFEWDKESRISRATDGNGGVLVTHYNEQGLVVKEIDPNGGETQHEYDEQWQLIKTIDPQGGATAFQYNELGLLTQQTDSLGNTQSIEYNDNGQPTNLIDPNGNHWHRDYDERGLLSQLTDPEGNKTQYQYNHLGQIALITNALGQTTQLMWSAKGQLLAEKDSDGLTTHYQYNQQEQITRAQQGNELSTEYQYDLLGNITQIKQANGQSQHFSYNSSGQLTQYTDGAGRQTQYQYDGLSQVRRRIDPMGQTLSYFYDNERNLTRLQNEKGESHQLHYDKNENLIAEIGFDGRRQHYRYNSANQLIEQIDGWCPEQRDALSEDQKAHIPEALVTQFQRDAQGRLTGKTTADGEQSTFAYNSLGQLTQAENPHSKVIYDYDSLGNPIEETQKSSHHSQSLFHEYDALGNRIKTTLPSGQVVSYQYNHQQLFTQVSLDDELISQIQRDSLGREINKQQGKLNARYHYDPMGRLASHQVTHKKNKHTVIQRGYGYDHAGNLSIIDDLKKGTTQYQYDALNRLTQVNSFISEQFAFDPAGNLLAQQSTADRTAQPTSPTQTNGNRLAFQGDRKFKYDAWGNLIKEQRGKEGQLQTEFAYNASNQLVKVTKQTSNKQEEYQYTYDALGRRINKTTPKENIDFIWNNDVLLSEHSTNNQDTEQAEPIQSKIYLYEPDSFKPLAIIQDQQIYHYHLDHLGTPQELTHHNGDLAWSVHYKAYGNVVKKVVESVENNLRFQGQYYDSETGLHYNRHRYYDPNTARFIHQDPIGLTGGNNNYQYADNPVAWIDPLGLTNEECLNGCVAKGGNKVFHYTDEVGAKAIEKTGVIRPDSKGRVFVTQDKVSAADANNALFMGRGGTKGTHRVEIKLKDGVNLNKGTQPNELIHKGSIRDPRQGKLKVKKNDF